MLVDEIQSTIDKYDYWDSRVKSLECNYFSDEVELVYDDLNGNDISYHFIGCYNCLFDHVKNYDKRVPVKNMSMAQIPYFLQEVTISEAKFENIELYSCEINMFPLYLKILCQDIKITKKKLQ